MPEKGWKSLTVRVSTYRIISRRAKRAGMTPDEWLTVNLRSGEGVSRGERVGVKAKKRPGRKQVDGQADREVEELERVIEEVQHRRALKK